MSRARNRLKVLRTFNTHKPLLKKRLIFKGSGWKLIHLFESLGVLFEHPTTANSTILELMLSSLKLAHFGRGAKGLVENSVVFFAPLVYNAQSEFRQKSVNSNFRKSEAKQIKSVYRRTKIMFPQLLAITEKSPFWSLPVIYGHLLSRTRANWEINLRKERLNPDSELFFTDLTTLW